MDAMQSLQKCTLGIVQTQKKHSNVMDRGTLPNLLTLDKTTTTRLIFLFVNDVDHYNLSGLLGIVA